MLENWTVIKEDTNFINCPRQWDKKGETIVDFHLRLPALSLGVQELDGPE